MKNIGEYIREHNWIVVLVLLSMGIALLYVSTHFGRSSEAYILMINLGAALIVSAIATGILSRVGREVEKRVDTEVRKMHEQIKIVKDKLTSRSDILKDELTNKLDILAEANKCEILHIFKSRRGEEEKFKKELLKAFEKVDEGKEVLIMSNSLRDFFGPMPQREYLNAFFDMLRKKISFKVLLLDPTSRAAKARALVEESESVKKHGYINSALFTTIKKVAENLDDPTTLVAHNNLRKGIKEQIEVRFFPYDPTTHLIITDKFTFVEQYHRGGNEEIKRTLERQGIPDINCFGGFSPVFMVANSATFAELMKSHFDNIWNSNDVKESDLRKNNYCQRILTFEENEKRKLVGFR